MKSRAPVLGILQAVSNHSVDHSGLNYLIELTQHFAGTYLKYRYKNLSRLLLVENVTLEEMAVDAIAPLFERDNKGLLKRINNAFRNWSPSIDTEEQALFFLNKLSAKSAEKYISGLLRESDPFFSKILRSINYIIKSRGYSKKQIMGTTYIVTESTLDISRLPSHQFIYDLPAYLFISSKDFISKVFRYIKEDTDKAEAIPVNALVIKIKKTGAQEFFLNFNTEIENDLEIKSIVDQAVSVTFDKLDSSYLNKKKIDQSDADALKKALQKIIIDLQDGGINTGLHKYLIEEIPSLSIEDYKKKYQNIFEYLYKVLKREITSQMKD